MGLEITDYLDGIWGRQHGVPEGVPSHSKYTYGHEVEELRLCAGHAEPAFDRHGVPWGRYEQVRPAKRDEEYKENMCQII